MQLTVFTRYDIRGNYPEELNETFALKLGKTAGSFAKKSIVLGCDARQSSLPLKNALIKGIISTGIDIIDIGIASTDKTALAGGYYKADFSVMVTASHNSWKQNGFKFLYQGGNGFSNEDLARIKRLFLSGKFRQKAKGKVINKAQEFNEIYDEKAIACFKKYFDSINATVVVDCCYSGARLPNLLEKLGAKVIKINCDTKPNFNLEPEPDEANRKYLIKIMEQTNADIVIGTDPDGDRIFAFDQNGWISGDELFCIFGKILKAKRIVASLDTSQMLNDATQAKITYTRVGDIFVSQKALAIDADFCGEPNGHYAFPTFCWYNSASFAGLLLAAIAKQLPTLRKNLPKYFVLTEKIECKNSEEKIKLVEELGHKIKEKYELMSDLDGVKFKIGNVIALIRASGTSPLIRIVVEGKDEKEVRKSYTKLSDYLKI